MHTAKFRMMWFIMITYFENFRLELPEVLPSHPNRFGRSGFPGARKRAQSVGSPRLRDISTGKDTRGDLQFGPKGSAVCRAVARCAARLRRPRLTVGFRSPRPTHSQVRFPHLTPNSALQGTRRKRRAPELVVGSQASSGQVPIRTPRRGDPVPFQTGASGS